MTRAEFRKNRNSPKFRADLAVMLSRYNREKQKEKPITRRQIKEAKALVKKEVQQKHARALLKSNIVAGE